MKAKITQGRGARGVVKYLLEEKNSDGGTRNHGENRGRIIGGTVIGSAATEIAQEFWELRQHRPEIKNPIWHCSLALPPGEKLEEEQWEEVADSFLSRMDLTPERRQYVVVLHEDKPHQHVHILVNRIGLDGSVWNRANDVQRAIRATQELEVVYGLTRTAGLPEPQKPIDKAPPNEPARRKLGRLIDGCTTGNPTVVEMVKRLKDAGVQVSPNLTGKGLLRGFSYSLDDSTWKGSRLGRAYSWNALQGRGVTYEPDRDRASLEILVQRHRPDPTKQRLEPVGPPPKNSEQAEEVSAIRILPGHNEQVILVSDDAEAGAVRDIEESLGKSFRATLPIGDFLRQQNCDRPEISEVLAQAREVVLASPRMGDPTIQETLVNQITPKIKENASVTDLWLPEGCADLFDFRNFSLARQEKIAGLPEPHIVRGDPGHVVIARDVPESEALQSLFRRREWKSPTIVVESDWKDPDFIHHPQTFSTLKQAEVIWIGRTPKFESAESEPLKQKLEEEFDLTVEIRDPKYGLASFAEMNRHEQEQEQIKSIPEPVILDGYPSMIFVVESLDEARVIRGHGERLRPRIIVTGGGAEPPCLDHPKTKAMLEEANLVRIIPRKYETIEKTKSIFNGIQQKLEPMTKGQVYVDDYGMEERHKNVCEVLAELQAEAVARQKAWESKQAEEARIAAIPRPDIREGDPRLLVIVKDQAEAEAAKGIFINRSRITPTVVIGDGYRNPDFLDHPEVEKRISVATRIFAVPTVDPNSPENASQDLAGFDRVFSNLENRAPEKVLRFEFSNDCHSLTQEYQRMFEPIQMERGFDLGR